MQVLETYFSSASSEPDPNIVVTRPGGALVIDGRTISSREPDFPQFVAGEEDVLFVRWEPQQKAYVVPRGAQGAFRELAGFLEQVSTSEGEIRAERGNVPSPTLTQEIRDLVTESFSLELGVPKAAPGHDSKRLVAQYRGTPARPAPTRPCGTQK